MGQKRRVTVRDGVAHVPLTKGYVALVDEADYPKVTGKSWSARVCLKADGSLRTVYAFRTQWIDGRRRNVGLHHVVAGVPPGTLLDHADGDGLNNRRGNVRAATPSQNAQNCARSVRNTSGVKGVYWSMGAGKWHARIKVSGRDHSLGLFRCITAAAVAYAKASRDMHREFGRLA